MKLNFAAAAALILCIGLFVNGCVFVDTHLNIAYDPIKSEKSAFSSAPSLKVDVQEFKDSRSEKVISYKNLAETGAILTQKPMSEVMRSAFQALLERNGHHVSGSDPQLIFEGEIKKFDMGFLPGVMTTTAVGNIVIRLNVKAPNRKVIFTKEYQANYNQKTAYATMKVWEQVLNGTLEKVMDDIAADPSFIEVFLAQTKQSAKTG